MQVQNILMIYLGLNIQNKLLTGHPFSIQAWKFRTSPEIYVDLIAKNVFLTGHPEHMQAWKFRKFL